MPNISDLEPYLNFLQSLSDMGAAMRRVMTQALISEDNYKKATGEGSIGWRLCVYDTLSTTGLLASDKRVDSLFYFLL